MRDVPDQPDAVILMRGGDEFLFGPDLPHAHDTQDQALSIQQSMAKHMRGSRFLSNNDIYSTRFSGESLGERGQRFVRSGTTARRSRERSRFLQRGICVPMTNAQT